MISLILNAPYSIIGILGWIISGPRSVKVHHTPYALILSVKSFWWAVGYMKGARAMAMGNIVLLSEDIEDKDLEHELVHVEQYVHFPLIYPILYHVELLKKGYRNNKYEVEAYTKAGNIYKD